MAWSYRLEAAKAVKFADVVERLGHEPLQEGRHHRCRMRDHRDDTPSMMVYPDNHGFYCWGCHVGGGGIDYVMGVEGLTLWEAISRIEDLFGLRSARGEGGRVRVSLSAGAADRVRQKYQTAPDIRAYASMVEGAIRSAAEGNGGPRGIPEELWREVLQAYAALDRLVDRGGGRDELDDLLSFTAERIADLSAALRGLTDVPNL